MKTASYRLIFAILVLCGVNGNASAATPMPGKGGLNVPAECAGSIALNDQSRTAPDARAGAVIAAEPPEELVLEDYLEWHGRVAGGSALNVLMPWAELHHNAN